MALQPRAPVVLSSLSPSRLVFLPLSSVPRPAGVRYEGALQTVNKIQATKTVMFYELNKANDRSDSVAEDLAEAREQSRRYKGEIRELNRRIDELAAQNAALAARDPAPAPTQPQPPPLPWHQVGAVSCSLARSLAVSLQLWFCAQRVWALSVSSQRVSHPG